ncbi:hypothetical protein ACH4JS_23530 [Streptomyces sp. NPDC017638]|uniref:hypothetical protein n=1 Tax=Streptomyces sp. NPDC017638 TaxID=3365004 RepID=UPI0037BD09E3
MTMLWRTVLSALQDPSTPGRGETTARGALALALALALKRTPEATADDVLKIALYEFGVVIEPSTGRGRARRCD